MGPGTRVHQIVLNPLGPDRSPGDVVKSLLHELGLLVLGHVPRGRQLAAWVNADGSVNELGLDQTIDRRAKEQPGAYDYIRGWELEAERWADEQMASWAAARKASSVM